MRTGCWLGFGIGIRLKLLDAHLEKGQYSQLKRKGKTSFTGGSGVLTEAHGRTAQTRDIILKSSALRLSESTRNRQ